MLSCYYLDALNKTEAVLLVKTFVALDYHCSHHQHHQVPYDDPDSMFEAARTAELRGAITVPQNFSHRS